jgi:hypothetical protein
MSETEAYKVCESVRMKFEQIDEFDEEYKDSFGGKRVHLRKLFKVQLSYKKRKLTTEYQCGSGFEPTVTDVVSCLISEEDCGNYSFEEFCRCFDYNTDSRKAEKTWKACQKNGKKLRNLLREDLPNFQEAFQDY